MIFFQIELLSGPDDVAAGARQQEVVAAATVQHVAVDQQVVAVLREDREFNAVQVLRPS